MISKSRLAVYSYVQKPLLRELDHPTVVKLLDMILAHPSGLYLIFEFVAHDLKTFMYGQVSNKQ